MLRECSRQGSGKITHVRTGIKFLIIRVLYKPSQYLMAVHKSQSKHGGEGEEEELAIQISLDIVAVAVDLPQAPSRWPQVKA